MNSLKFYAIILVVFPIYEIQSKLHTTTNNRTYYLEKDVAFTWNQAFHACSSRDMDLVSFDSKEKFEDFKALFETISEWDLDYWFWVGAVVDDRHASWTSSGKPLIPSLFKNIDPLAHCIQLFSGADYMFNFSCDLDESPALACEDRVSPANCCDRKYNVILNIKQLN